MNHQFQYQQQLPVAPMQAPSGFVPPDQLQRFGVGQTLRMVHYDTPLFGAGQLLGAETQLFSTNARLSNDDLCSLKEPGKFSDFKQYAAYGLSFQIFFDQLAAPAVGEASAEELYDLFVYFSRIHIRYQDAEKQILWSDLLPAGGGVTGYSQTTGAYHLTNGSPHSDNMFKFGDPMIITPQKTFRLTLRWMSSLQTVAGSPTVPDPLTRFNLAINSLKLIRVYLHGVEIRDMTNG